MASIRNLVVRISANDRQIAPAISRVNKSLGTLSKSAGKVGKITLIRTAQIGAVSALAGGAAAAAGSIVQLGAALAPVAGLLAAVPAAAVMAATALGVLKLATSGVGDAMGAALAGDTKKFEESLKKLSPAARQFAQEFKNTVPAMKAFQQSAQQGFFEQLTGSLGGFSNLLQKTGPYVRTLAAEMGKWARGFIDFATAKSSVGQLQNILGLTRGTLKDLRGALQPVLKGFLDLAEVGAFFIRGMGPGMAGVATKFGQWLSQIAKSGQAMQWMETGLAVVKQLGAVLANVGGILKSVFTAAGQSGGNLLGTFGALTGALNAFLKTPAGKTALTQLFQGLAGIGKALAPVLVALVKGIGSIAPAVGRIAMAVGPVLAMVVNALAPALKKLEPGIKALIRAMGGAIEALGPALVPLAEAISAIVVGLTPLLPAMGKLVGGLLVGLAKHVNSMIESGALSTLVDAIILLAGTLGTALLEAIVAVSPYLPDLVVALSDLLISLVPLIPLIVDFAIAFLPLIPIITDAITLLAEIVTEVMPGLVLIMQIATKQVGWLAEAMQFAWGFIADFIRSRIDKIGVVIAILAGLPAKFSKWFGSARDAAAQKLSNLLAYVSTVAGNIRHLFSNAGSWLKEAGGNIMTGLWNGIVGMADWIQRSIGNLIKAIIPGPIRRVLGIASPSKLTTYFGEMLGAGLVNGMDATQGIVARAAASLAGAAIPQMATPGVPGMSTPAGVSRSTGSGSRDGFDYARLASAFVEAMRKEGVGATYIDGQQMTDHVSRRMGRATDQRRRTG